MTRLAGLSAGGTGLALSWLGGAAIARLTGATPVVIVLIAGLALFLIAAVDGWLALHRTAIGSVTLPPTSTQGEVFGLAAELTASRPVWVEARVRGGSVAGAWSDASRWAARGSVRRRGVVDSVEMRVRSAGGLGLVWWSRRFDVAVDPHLVAAAAVHGDVPIDRSPASSEGGAPGATGAVAGEIDGVRPWREGDSEKFVHWASSMRTGTLVVHDRRNDSDEHWVVRPRRGTADPDGEAGGARWALEQGLRAGARMQVVIDDAEPVNILDVDAAARWSATAELGDVAEPKQSWWSRRRSAEPETTAPMTARWWAAGATFVSLAMLAGALGYGPFAVVVIAASVVAGALVSGRTLVTGEQPSSLIRTLIGLGALAGLGVVVASSGRFEGLLAFLRGPLPQVLVVLILLHGFECRDRRTIRVGLGISAVVVMYASAFRVDDSIAIWLLTWAAGFGVALSALSRPTNSSSVRPDDLELGAVASLQTSRLGRLVPSAGWFRPAGLLGAGVVASVALLAVVPVPDGPARLTLPTFVSGAAAVGQPGAIAGPDGTVRNEGTSTTGDRAPLGQAGGYTGFAQSMDTSVRGALSDEVVMRVRAPEADFWRGQTFAEFDGRTWFADDELGSLRTGPNVDIPAALGDTRVSDAVAVEQFVQTFYLEADMPNVVFHAYRPEQVILDADVWTRADGAIRSSSILPEGSVYTVVSARARVDEMILRRQGIIGDRLNPLGRQVLGRFLEVPASTSPATVALAAELAEGRESTYEVIRAYERWMNANVVYDLDAPLPDTGEDAVHDFLFDSRRGFCEQIASALTVMLRTQGVPARLATGYVSGSRDRVAGVFEVKASDAHAWVEVWFPETGWQAFDPTAAVPLSADSQIDSVGADLAAGARSYLSDHPMTVMSVVVLVAGVLAVLRLVGVLRHRRRRGRWGLLQDRFATSAVRRGAPSGVPNPRLAASWTTADDSAVACLVAERLDRVAFDPGFTDDDRLYADTRKLIGSLPTTDR